MDTYFQGCCKLPFCRLRTLLANDSNTRKERWMQSLSSHQASEATAPQLATRPWLRPAIQADEIERHRTADLLQVDGWLPSRACLSRVQGAHRLGNAGFHPTAQPILVPIRVIALPLPIGRQPLRLLRRRQAQLTPLLERTGTLCAHRTGGTDLACKEHPDTACALPALEDLPRLTLVPLRPPHHLPFPVYPKSLTLS